MEAEEILNKKFFEEYGTTFAESDTMEYDHIIECMEQYANEKINEAFKDLPEFLIKDDKTGKIFTGYHGGEDVTEEWENYKNQENRRSDKWLKR